MENKKHLIVFGTDDYQNSINSLIKSSSGYFDEFHIFSKKNIDDEFYEKNKNILDQRRGAGYWLWKPYFILKTLNLINDGDIVFYVDAGNIFINDPSDIFKEIDNNNIICLFL